MANIQKRGDYRPRRTREREAYRLVVAGVVGGFLPVVLLAIAGGCAWRFRRITGRR
jgi:hypothetical protein